MVNRYDARCFACGGIVPRNGGALMKRGGRWVVFHPTCSSGGRVNTIIIGGREYTRNARGRCEDAPCCGCCTI